MGPSGSPRLDADDSDPWELLPSALPGPAEAEERREQLCRQREALAALKGDERRALLLLGLGLSYAEICEACSWSYTKVNRCLAEDGRRCGLPCPTNAFSQTAAHLVPSPDIPRG